MDTEKHPSTTGASASVTEASTTNSTKLDETALEQANGGIGELLGDIAARVNHAVEKKDWKSFFDSGVVFK